MDEIESFEDGLDAQKRVNELRDATKAMENMLTGKNATFVGSDAPANPLIPPGVDETTYLRIQESLTEGVLVGVGQETVGDEEEQSDQASDDANGPDELSVESQDFMRETLGDHYEDFGDQFSAVDFDAILEGGPPWAEQLLVPELSPPLEPEVIKANLTVAPPHSGVKEPPAQAQARQQQFRQRQAAAQNQPTVVKGGAPRSQVPPNPSPPNTPSPFAVPFTAIPPDDHPNRIRPEVMGGTSPLPDFGSQGDTFVSPRSAGMMEIEQAFDEAIDAISDKDELLIELLRRLTFSQYRTIEMLKQLLDRTDSEDDSDEF